MHTDIKQSSFYITTYVIGLQKKSSECSHLTSTNT